MSFYPELHTLSLPDLQVRFQSPSPEEPEYAYGYFTEVAMAIVKYGREGIDFLVSEARRADSDQDRVRAVVNALTFASYDNLEIMAFLEEYITDSRPLIVAEAIDTLSIRNDASIVDQIRSLMNHGSPYVRGSVLRYLSHMHDVAAIPDLLLALNDHDAIVRETAIDQLDVQRVITAIPDIRRLLTDHDAGVREAASQAIESLTDLSGEDKE